MSSSKEIEEQINFFVENLCPQSEKIYHLSIMLFLNTEDAKKCLDETYELAADKIKVIAKEEDSLLELVKCCWSVSQKIQSKSVDETLNLSKVLKNLNTKERFVIACVDVLNITYSLIALSVGWNSNEISDYIISARKKIITNT